MNRIILYLLFMALPSSAVNAHAVTEDIKTMQSIELGQALLLLMPDRNIKQYHWDHRANSEIIWLDQGYRQETLKGGDIESTREGLLRINVQGRFSSVLRKNKEELPWTVRYQTRNNPKFGVRSITLSPGLPLEGCFGNLYENCDFELIPSLRSSGIKFQQFCKNDGLQFRVTAYQISHPNRAHAVLIHYVTWGSGGTHAHLELNLQEKTAEQCAV